MQRALAKTMIFLLALTLVVPESYARRLGGGRSVGRQAPMSRQSTAGAQAPAVRPYAPLPPAAPPMSNQPDYARQNAPARPMQPAPAQGRPWGGMVGGALLGLGLGSLLSSGQHNNNVPNPNMNNQGNRDTTGSGGVVNGTDASGNPGIADATTAAPTTQAPTGGGFGSVLLWGILGLAAFFLLRRMRARAAQRRF